MREIKLKRRKEKFREMVRAVEKEWSRFKETILEVAGYVCG